jgi:hypothetical protein
MSLFVDVNRIKYVNQLQHFKIVPLMWEGDTGCSKISVYSLGKLKVPRLFKTCLHSHVLETSVGTGRLTAWSLTVPEEVRVA